MSGWSFLVYVCTPVPLVLLAILTMPLPKAIRRGVLSTTKGLIFLPLVGGIQAIHVMLVVSTGAVLDQSFRTTELRGRDRPVMEADIQILKGKIWRSERNFWIALFCFFVWWMLSSYYRTLIKLIEVKEENERLKEELNPPREETDRPADKKND